MKAGYRYAVLSYVRDVGGAKSAAVPLGVVGVATGAQGALLALVIRQSARGWKELGAGRLMQDALDTLAERCEAALLEAVGRVGPERSLDWLAGRWELTNIHVSYVHREEESVRASGGNDLPMAVLTKFLERYREHVEGRGRSVSAGLGPKFGVRPVPLRARA